MKTIIYSLIAMILIGTMATGFKSQRTANETILIESSSRISGIELTKSAEILKARLKSFYGEQFELSTLPEQNQIKIVLTGNQNTDLVEKLLTQKGTLAFYETYNAEERSAFIEPGNQIYKLLGNADNNYTGSEIGYAETHKVDLINEYLDKSDLRSKIFFAWSQNKEDDWYCLYTLKPDVNNGCILTGNDVQEIGSTVNQDYNQISIKIRFHSDVARKWADATKKNLKKSIAIVLDGRVVLAPVVQSPMETGFCELTGNFEPTMVSYFVALGNNGELPVKFKVVSNKY